MVTAKLPAPARRCARKFLRFFPGGFADETYIDWERGSRPPVLVREDGPARHRAQTPGARGFAVGLERFAYASRPARPTYASLLAFVARVRRDLRPVPGLRARDMIDLQSFLWVRGSSEYDED